MARPKLTYIGPPAEILQFPSGKQVRNPAGLTAKQLQEQLERCPEFAKYVSTTGEKASDEEE